MILAQFVENSGLKDQIGAGIVLTGGFSKMEGIRDLAVATFGSIPVRLARPIETDGLFDELRGAEFSTVIGLIMYSAYAYTAYEIDANNAKAKMKNGVLEITLPIKRKHGKKIKVE